MVDDWTRLCRLLDDDPALASSVSLAVADPGAYAAQHEHELPGSEAERADGVDPWLVIIDGLDEAGALAYLDGQDSGAELADALAGLPRVFRAGVDLDPVADIPDLTAAIVRADEILAPRGLRVVHLDEDSDACPLVVVPVEHADEIVSLSARLGCAARVFP